VKERVADYKRLRGGVVFVDAIPKNASGKILKKDLRALAQKDAQREGGAKL
jgi:4-coumarate--CoA ligase